MVPISAIKLIRTDTTLDLSEKAEKGMICSSPAAYLFRPEGARESAGKKGAELILDISRIMGVPRKREGGNLR